MSNCVGQFGDDHRRPTVDFYFVLVSCLSWASAHRGKWGQLTPPEKWMKKQKAKTWKKSIFLNTLWAIRAGRCRKRRYADHVSIQIYSRMHPFVVEFSKFSSPQAARGHWPPNQNHADPPVVFIFVSLFVSSTKIISTCRPVLVRTPGDEISLSLWRLSLRLFISHQCPVVTKMKKNVIFVNVLVIVDDIAGLRALNGWARPMRESTVGLPYI